MIEVVGIVATCDGKNAGAQDVGKRVNNTRRVASIRAISRKLSAIPRRRSASAKSIHTTVGS